MPEDDLIEAEPSATAIDGRGFRDRRTVLKTIGVGAVFPLVTGTAAAGGTEDDGSGEDADDDHDDADDDGEGMEFDRYEPCIDPLTGWTTLSADDTGGFDVDHVVDMRIEPVTVAFYERFPGIFGGRT